MDCDFIKQVRHILRHSDFQDIQLVVLPTYCNDELTKIGNLIFSSDKEQINIGKSQLLFDLNKILPEFDETKKEIDSINIKLNKYVKTKNIVYIEILEDELNDYRELINEISNFISELLCLALRFDWTIFKDQKWYNLMIEFVPVYSTERKLFEKHIQKPKGRPRTEKKYLHEFLTDEKKYNDLIPLLISEYWKSKPNEIHYMVYVLYKMEIFNSSIIDNKTSLHKCLQNNFGKSVGSRQILSKKLDELITLGLEPDTTKYEFHRNKIVSIIKKMDPNFTT